MATARLTEIRRRIPSVPGILGREEYHTCGVLVPLLHRDGKEQLLFEKRSPHIRQGSEICFPGGHFDGSRDGNCLETALREAHEELGLQRRDIEIIGQLDTIVSPRGIIVECYLGHVNLDDLSLLRLHEGEVEQVFTVPVCWFRDHPPDIYRTRVEIQSSYIDGDGRERILLPVEELGLPVRYKNNRSEWLHRVVVYRRQPDIIWGMTAAIVENCIARYLA